MPQVENEDLAILAYNCFAEHCHWLDPSGLGPMMRWEALRDDLRIGYGKMVTCVMDELTHRETRSRMAHDMRSGGRHETTGAPPQAPPLDYGASGDPVPPGARGGVQAAPTPNVPRTGPHPEATPTPPPAPKDKK